MLEYSGGMVSRPFLYTETKQTAKLMVAGVSKDEIKSKAINDNIYQVPSADRANGVMNTAYRRLSVFDDNLVKAIAESDITTSKVLVFIGIMRTDRLVFEFMHEVFREKVILGDMTIKSVDLDKFFDAKKAQSDIVAKFSESTVKKLKSSYLRILYEIGLLTENNDIKLVNIDYKVEEHLKANGMTAYLNAIMGE
ncbi:MAG TPA: DUF1819 domain-containing protein [Clostridiales bacterium]|nr:MAG: hypothetical protein A2Y18_05165 [Clostridiales bacterium GWD2_32_19]HCC06815.1 DUF1819 domain-containing protein [Clostridiales bacterium]